MKYCPRCKLRMPADATVCNKCGAPLRTVGGGAAGGTSGNEPGAATPGNDADLGMQLQGLQHEVQRSRTALRATAGLAIGLTALLVLLLVGLRLYNVLQYAEVDRLDVRLTKNAPGEAQIEFVRRNLGKVEFIREAAGRTETLVDHGRQDAESTAAQQSFVWSAGNSGDFTLRVRVRHGWSTAEQVWIAHAGEIRQQN